MISKLKKNEAVILSPSHNIWGGGQIYIESLSRYIADSQDKVPIVTSEPQAFSVDTISIPRIDDRWYRLTKSVPIALRLRRLGVRRILLNDLAALWLAPVFRGLGFHVASLMHMHPRLKTAPGIGHSRFEWQMLRVGASACHKLFSVSRQNIDVFGDEVIFVGNYAPSEFFYRRESQREIKKKYDLVFVARLAREKHPIGFVELVRHLARSLDKPISVLMVGSGPLDDEVNTAIREAGLTQTIERRPWVNRADLPALLDRAKCFVMTSLYEGFATTVIEAHARGLPVVTTETSGFCPEFVREFGGATGLVFNATSYEPETLSRQIAELIDNHETLAPLCRQKAALFTQESVLSPIRDWLVGTS